MMQEGLTTAFVATARHITEPHVIDPSTLLELHRWYWPLRCSPPEWGRVRTSVMSV